MEKNRIIKESQGKYKEPHKGAGILWKKDRASRTKGELRQFYVNYGKILRLNEDNNINIEDLIKDREIGFLIEDTTLDITKIEIEWEPSWINKLEQQ